MIALFLTALIASTAVRAQFDVFQALPTDWGNDAAFFTFGSQTFLAIAQLGATEIYKYNGTAFADAQSISCGAGLCIGVTAFVIDGNQYIVIAAYNTDDGAVYKYSTQTGLFAMDQTIHMSKPRKFEFTTINGNYYLGVTDQILYSSIFQWSAGSFSLVQKITMSNPLELAFFNVNSTSFLGIIASGSSPSVIYTFDSSTSQFVAVQHIQNFTTGSDIAFYAIGSSVYVAFTTNTANAYLYKWDGTLVNSLSYQSTLAAFEVDSTSFVVVGAGAHDFETVDKSFSQVWNFDVYTQQMSFFQTLNTSAGVGKFVSLSFDGDFFLASAEVGPGQGVIEGAAPEIVDSHVWIWTGASS